MKSERSSSGRRRRVVAFLISWSGFFWLTLSLLLLSCFRLSSPPLPWWSWFSSSSPSPSPPFSSSSSSTSYLTLSTLLFPSRHHHRRHGDDDGLHHHQLVATWPHPVMEAISSLSTPPPMVSILHSVTFPDQISIFLKYPPSAPLFPADAIDCVYRLNNNSSSSSSSTITLRPLHIDSTTGGSSSDQIVRCPPPPRGYSATVGFLYFFNNKKNKRQQESGPRSLRRQAVVLPLPPGPTTYRWDWLAYEATIDHNDDNTTVVFAKGFNLRPGRLSDPTRFQCVYGWDLSERPRTRFFLRSEVLSIGQEVVRCKTPLAVLNGPKRLRDPIKVSVRLTGRATLPSIARPVRWQPDEDSQLKNKKQQPPQPQPLYEMCVCTMVRNQARFLREWVMYHSRVGVQRWFIYDNNSDDDVDEVIRSLNDQDYNISKHVWPWIKSQEAGFAHCALRARGQCNWVGFIDVDEFFHFPSSSARLSSLHDVLRNYSNQGKGKNVLVGEIRTFCYNFGPSGLRRAPAKGVTVGYTCRLAVHERHKSIVRPEALSPTLMNAVHHFQLREGFRAVTLDRPAMVINHYKYQVWQVFKDKFYRRVATYVSDWTDEANVGSKDRAPGLGTQAVEPPNWPAWFCEVNDTRLRDVVLNEFADPDTRILPWEESSSSRTDQ